MLYTLHKIRLVLNITLRFSLSKSDKNGACITKPAVHEMANDKLLICIYIKQMTATVHTKSWLIFQLRLSLTPREVYFPGDRKPGLLTTRRPFYIFTGSDLYLNLKLSILLANQDTITRIFAMHVEFDLLLSWFSVYMRYFGMYRMPTLRKNIGSLAFHIFYINSQF